MPRKLSPEDEDAIIERYQRWRPRIDDESLVDIAKELGTTKTTIMTVLRRRGIPYHQTTGRIAPPATDVVAFGNELIKQLEDKRRLEARVAHLEKLLADKGIAIPPRD